MPELESEKEQVGHSSAESARKTNVVLLRSDFATDNRVHFAPFRAIPIVVVSRVYCCV